METPNHLVEFFFDPVSPYAWLASVQLERLRMHGSVEIDTKPVLFAALLGANEHKGPAEIPTKRAYTFRDVMRCAAWLDVAFEGPPAHPFVPLLLLRTTLAIEERATRWRYACAVMNAVWSEGADPTDRRTVEQVASTCDLDADALLAAAETPAIKVELAEQTKRALERGVFGVPTFIHADELYWGADRVEHLASALRGDGPRVDEARLAQTLARPWGATRSERRGR